MATTAQRNRQKSAQKYDVRNFSRCQLCGRPRAVYRKFQICRICLRKMALEGKIPGMQKSSW